MVTPGDSTERGGPTPAETLRYKPQTAEGRLLVKLCTWLDPATPTEDIGYPFRNTDYPVERRSLRQGRYDEGATSDAYRACFTLKDEGRKILTFNNYHIFDHVRLNGVNAADPNVLHAALKRESLASLQAGDAIINFDVKPPTKYNRHPLDGGHLKLFRPCDISLNGMLGRMLVPKLLDVNIQEEIVKPGWKDYELDLRANFNEALTELGCSATEAVVWRGDDLPPQPSTAETRFLVNVLGV